MRATLAACCLALAAASAAASAAWAQEAIQTGPGGRDAPPTAPASAAPATVADPDNSPAANGAWARRVLSGQKAEPAADGKPQGRCQPPPDRKPHGEVHAGIGTGGYREVGGVVTQPIGDCGHLTIAIDKTEFDGGRRRRR